MFSPLIKSISESELAFIAGLDYGQNSVRHLESLRTVIFGQDGMIHEGQRWFPYEVIELGANALRTSHEREFVICTLLVIQAVIGGFDSATDLEAKFSERAQDYDLLHPSLSEEVLRAYQLAKC